MSYEDTTASYIAKITMEADSLRTALEAERAKVAELEAAVSEYQRIKEIHLKNIHSVQDACSEVNRIRDRLVDERDSLAALVASLRGSINSVLKNLTDLCEQQDAVKEYGFIAAEERCILKDALVLTPADLADVVCVKREEWNALQKEREVLKDAQEQRRARLSGKFRIVDGKFVAL